MQQLKNARSKTAGSTTSAFAAPFAERVEVEICSDYDAWYAWGESGGSVSAAGAGAVLLPGGVVRRDTPLAPNLYLHVIRAGAVNATVNAAEVDRV